MDKQERHRLIRDLVSSQGIGSQEELVNLLKKKGLRVTQATVSRDIDELGLMKTKSLSGRSVYILQGRQSRDPLKKLNRTFGEFGLSVEESGNMVVIKTSPGAAQTVAKAIDELGLSEIIGTVAGDDTIMMVVREESNGAKVRKLFEDMME